MDLEKEMLCIFCGDESFQPILNITKYESQSLGGFNKMEMSKRMQVCPLSYESYNVIAPSEQLLGRR